MWLVLDVSVSMLVWVAVEVARNVGDKPVVRSSPRATALRGTGSVSSAGTSGTKPTISATSIPALGACSRTRLMAPVRTMPERSSSCFERRAAVSVEPCGSVRLAVRDASSSNRAAASLFSTRKLASGFPACTPGFSRQVLHASQLQVSRRFAQIAQGQYSIPSVYVYFFSRSSCSRQ